MQRNFFKVSKYKNTSGFGEDIYYLKGKPLGQHCFFISDLLNEVENPRYVFLARKEFEVDVRSQYVGFHLPGLNRTLDTRTYKKISDTLFDKNFHLYTNVDGDSALHPYTLRGDGKRILRIRFIDQYIMNERKYILDAFVEKLTQRDNLWIGTNINSIFDFLKTPLQPEDEAKISGIIHNFDLNKGCDGLDSDYCKAICCFVDFTQDEIERLFQFVERFKTRTLTKEEKTHNIRSVEDFIAYDILGGKDFLVSESKP